MPETSAPSSETETAAPAGAARQSIYDWARDLRTKRTEFCLAAMVAGWHPEQPDPEAWESAPEVQLTRAEFEEAIRAGRVKAAEVRSKAGLGGGRFDVLGHPELLLAVCIKRPTAMDCDRFLRGIMSDEAGEKEEALKQIFNDCVLYPLGDQLLSMRNSYALAWLVFANKIGDLAGLAKADAKKKR